MSKLLKCHHISLASKILAYFMVSSVFLYLFNNYLVYWQDMPGPYLLFSHFGWLGDEADTLNAEQLTQGWWQVVSYAGVYALAVFYVIKNKTRDIRKDAERFEQLSAYLVRSAFWAVLLIGSADVIISFMRVEKLLEVFISDSLIAELGRPTYRGTYVHYPLLTLSFVVAFFVRNISFSWLALMVVLAEFQIVITRFVFSYEQAFMGDLVRFWYAALFLFASAYTLVHEGHVRVDVLYAAFSERKKAWSNIIGCLFLGIPLCWVILMHGMGGKGNSINSPLLSFEISQSGYGMYVKYIMAAFLVVFSVSMMIQFVSYLLQNIAQLIDPQQSASNVTDSDVSSTSPQGPVTE
jgi:TRAP-type mannitol/chloroaromatic compound transport system permease small subunit